MIPSIEERNALTVTLNTTEDCNLRCKYCYEINKRKKELPLEYAKMFIDRLLEDPDPCNLLNDEDPFYRIIYKKGLTLDAIGGDSLMNVKFLDEVYSYYLKKIMTGDYPNSKYWRGNTRFSISTNGTLFLRPEVREFCEKWKDMLNIGISLDGCPTIHDMNRVYPNGRGSMGDIVKSWDWYRSVFPEDSKSTKATASVSTIPYLYDSLKYLHEDLGITHINQNFIMENTFATKEDYKLLEEQMEKCIGYVLDHCDDMYWSMIDKMQFGMAHRSQDSDWTTKGHCGSGAMPCLSVDGLIYPCHRWLSTTQKGNSTDMCVGNVWDGFNKKENFRKVREGAYRANCTREQKCIECPYESACAYCIGGCYSEFGDFIRTTYICEYTKIQVKWARIYWEEYNKKKGIPPINWEEESSKIRR